MGDIMSIKLLADRLKLTENLRKLFSFLDETFLKYIEENKDEIPERFNTLYKKFKETKDKVEDDDWLKLRYTNIFLNNFDYVTESNNKYEHLIYALEYINSINISRAKILDNDQEYNKIIINSIDDSTKYDDLTYKNILELLSNEIVKDIINRDKDDNMTVKKDNIKVVIGLFEDRKNSINNNIQYSYDNIEEEFGLLKINDYYNYQYAVNKQLGEDVENISNVKKILEINDLSEEIKDKYINSILFIRTLGLELQKELEVVSETTNLFCLLKDEIKEYTNDQLNNIIVQKYINSADMNENKSVSIGG